MNRVYKLTPDDHRKRVDRVQEFIDKGLSVADAIEKSGLKTHNAYYVSKRAVTNQKFLPKRKYVKKAVMVTLPVANEVSDKLCVFVGSPNQVIQAVKELLR